MNLKWLSEDLNLAIYYASHEQTCFWEKRTEKIPASYGRLLSGNGTLDQRKYKSSMEFIAKTIRKFSDTPGLDLVELLKRSLFFFLTGNADIHLKNFSFLYEGHTRRLAPAYDLLSTRLVISEKDDSEELALPSMARRAG